MIQQIKDISIDILDDIIKIRRHIHQYPELSFNEYKTSEYIKSILDAWKICFTDNIADTGIVVLLKGKNPDSKTVALRADFDALPIEEENEVNYRSVNHGVMHACGHDVHTACLLGAVKILYDLRAQWEGTVKCIFQPAEEKFPGGANQMIKEGVLDNPKVEKIFAQHVFPELSVGKVGFYPGEYMASADELYIIIDGQEGHAALPEKYNNPIVAAAKLITELEEYFFQYREAPSVFAIGYIYAKGHTNVIPKSISLKGTFRAMDEQFRILGHKKMQEIASKIADMYKVNVDFKIMKGYPVLKNDIVLTNQLINIAKEYLGEKNVVMLEKRMTAEDFAYYSQQLPACFYRLGTANLSKGISHGLHTSRFNIDEDALLTGVGLMAYFAIKS